MQSPQYKENNKWPLDCITHKVILNCLLTSNGSDVSVCVCLYHSPESILMLKPIGLTEMFSHSKATCVCVYMIDKGNLTAQRSGAADHSVKSAVTDYVRML